MHGLSVYRIKYEEFNTLLESKNWLLAKGMKNNWTAQDHLNHIDNVYHKNHHLIIDFYVDALSLRSVKTIDVFIPSSEATKDGLSRFHHVQFIRNDTKTID